MASFNRARWVGLSLAVGLGTGLVCADGQKLAPKFKRDVGASSWTLDGPGEVQLDRSRTIQVPCMVHTGEKEDQGLALKGYFTASDAPPGSFDMKAETVKCDADVQVPEHTKFLVLAITSDPPAPAKSRGAKNSGASFVVLPITDPVITPNPAEPNPASPKGPSSTAAGPSSPLPLIVAGIALLAALLAVGYTIYSAAGFRRSLQALQEQIPVGLSNRLAALDSAQQARAFAPPPLAPSASPDLAFKLEALTSRLDRMEAARELPDAGAGLSAVPEAVLAPAADAPVELPPQAQDARRIKMLEEIDKVGSALENWSRVAPAAADRDIKGDASELEKVYQQVENAPVFDKAFVQAFLRCSRSAAIKIMYAADTAVDPRRSDPDVQAAVAQVVAAARLAIIDPPLNSDPREYKATVLSATVQARSGDQHGRVALVERRGLRYNTEIVQAPQVRVYD